MMMQRIEREGKINIFNQVKELQKQGWMMMMQTVEQYIFLYSLAKELVEAKKGRKNNLFQKFFGSF